MCFACLRVPSHNRQVLQSIFPPLVDSGHTIVSGGNVVSRVIPYVRHPIEVASAFDSGSSTEAIKYFLYSGLHVRHACVYPVPRIPLAYSTSRTHKGTSAGSPYAPDLKFWIASASLIVCVRVIIRSHSPFVWSCQVLVYVLSGQTIYCFVRSHARDSEV